jgi:hypothetical protein
MLIDFHVFVDSLPDFTQFCQPQQQSLNCNPNEEFPLQDSDGNTLPSISINLGGGKFIYILSFLDAQKYGKSGNDAIKRINVRSANDCGNYPISVYDATDRAKIYRGLTKCIRTVNKHLMNNNKVVINCNHGRSRSVIVALGKISCCVFFITHSLLL